jgi:hypothetical protein
MAEATKPDQLVLLALRRELDAFREGNYVPIINEYC